MEVELVYADANAQRIYRLQLPQAATIAQAVEASGVLKDFPTLDLAQSRVGVFSKLATLAMPLREGDRVEIYRPLSMDAKQARFARVEAKRLRKLREQGSAD